MSKHIADTPSKRSDRSRLEHYTEIERKAGDGRSAREKALTRQKKAPEGKDRLKRYLEIERQSD